MKAKLTALWLLCLVGAARSQSPADWWFFGNYAGMHFTAAGPVSVTGGALSTTEGCAALSDPQGNLLFYTDGSTIYNANHTAMPNGTGLLGNPSSSNSGIIVPRPQTPNQYYCISQSTAVGTGITFSLVDMTLSGGLGDVVAGQKNISLYTGTRENVTSVKHANGHDFWIITHMSTSSNFAAFLITSAGISNTPVISTTNASCIAQFGVIKTSPNGEYVCYCSQADWRFKVGLFDNATGQISQAFTYIQPGGSNATGAYGVEFSSDSKVMYISSRQANGYIRQYDMSLFDSTTIINSEYTVASSVPTGALQLGPDERIYVATNNNPYVHCIQQPTVLGAGCTFVNTAIVLSANCRQGLPNFSPSWFAPDIQITQFCFTDSTYFSADTSEIDMGYWNFGDPASGALNVAYGFQATHLYTDTGMYEATFYFIPEGDTNWDSTTHDVHIYPRQTATVGSDTTICAGSQTVLTVVPQGYSTYGWNTSATTQSITVTTTGQYIVTVFGICDTVSDTAFVTVDQPFVVNLGPNQTICNYDSTTLTPNLTGTLQYTWNTGDTTPTVTVNTTGTYTVTVTNGTCTYSDAVVVNHYPNLSVELGPDQTFCYIPSATLTPMVQNATGYFWNNGTGAPTYTTGQTGLIAVTVTDGNGCFKEDYTMWSFYNYPIADLGEDTAFCAGDNILLDTKLPLSVNFLWSTGETTSAIAVDDIALYWVEVSDEHCTMRDSVLIERYPDLLISLGNDIKTCDGKEAVLSVKEANDVLTEYFWSTGSQDSETVVSKAGKYTVTVSNGLCLAFDDINVFYFEYPPLDFGPDTEYCAGTELWFDVTSWNTVSYQWHDETTAPSHYVEVTKPTTIWAALTNEVCTTVDTLHIGHHPDPAFTLPETVKLCQDSTVVLRAAGDSAFVYTWASGIKSMEHKVAVAGVYTLSSFDGLCGYTDSVIVVDAHLPDVQLFVEDEICEGQTLSITTNIDRDSVDFMMWSTGSTLPEINIKEAGTYWLEARNHCGWGSDTATVILCGCFVRLPNTFHPDGNKHNETFGAVLDCPLTDFELTVHDRWGKVIFTATDPAQHWDGKHLGNDLPVGTYGWVLKYSFDNHGHIEGRAETGTVSILR